MHAIVNIFILFLGMGINLISLHLVSFDFPVPITY